MKLQFMAASLLTLHLTSSSAMSGSQLNTLCHGAEGGVYQAYCAGYIRGSMDGLESMRAVHMMYAPEGPRIQGFCIPGATVLGDIVDVVKKFLNDNPQDRGDPASLLVNHALITAFPCK